MGRFISYLLTLSVIVFCFIYFGIIGGIISLLLAILIEVMIINRR